MPEHTQEQISHTLCLFYGDAKPSAQAKAIAQQLSIPVFGERQPKRWNLVLSNGELSLCRPDKLSLSIDFISGKAISRSREANFAKQPLAKAIGVSAWRKLQGSEPCVVDATTGLGTDAWMMALLGCEVTMLERSAVLHCMLGHELHRARELDNTALAAMRTQLYHADAQPWLAAQTGFAADVIYLDPMYPGRRKQAMVKKGMQLLHELIGPDTNNEQLLPTALRKARYRVVVKRPKGAPLMQGSDAHTGQRTEVQSPNTRFDVYHVNAAL